MKALTVRQPWATVLVRGVKTVEYRTWPTTYRGLLAIHAGRALPSLEDYEQLLRVYVHGVREQTVRQWVGNLPRGYVLGTVQVAGCRPVRADEPGRCWGKWAWELEEAEAWDRPVWAVGKQGIWEWEERGDVRVHGVRADVRQDERRRGGGVGRVSAVREYGHRAVPVDGGDPRPG
jgi:activating signal cointegrator 1